MLDLSRVERGDLSIDRLPFAVAAVVGNAVRYTDEGAVELRALPSAEAPSARFEVADAGIGVPEDARTRIFEPFVQADVSVTRRHGGTGLGLTICRELGDALGGTIGTAPRAGGGSLFWAELPLPAVAPPADGERRLPVVSRCCRWRRRR